MFDVSWRSQLRIGDMLVPQRLIDCIADDSMQNVSDSAIHRAIPRLDAANNINLITSIDYLIGGGNNTINSGYEDHEFIGMHYGRDHTGKVELPLLDLERSFFIGYGRRDGDDTWLALHYAESSEAEPSVVTNAWIPPTTDGRQCEWYIVQSTFGQFADCLGIASSS